MKKLLWSTLLISSSAFAARTYLNPRLEEPPFAVTEADKERFGKLRERALALHDARTKALNEGPLTRTFHNKIHGCLHGKFTLSDSRPDKAKYGFFEKQDVPYDVWFRFTNINQRPDNKPDLRGLGMRLVDPDAPKDNPLMGQDFLANDTKRHFVSTPEDIIEFNEYAARGDFAGYAAKGPIYLARLQDVQKNQSDMPASLLVKEYHSRAPFKLGPSDIKYALIPCGANGVHDEVRGEDYLGINLAKNAKAETLCFKFIVQFFDNETTTPLFDYTKEWQSERVEIGTINFEPQDIAANQKDCEKFSFDPWNTLEEHIPTGDVNKGRWYIYSASKSHATPAEAAK